MATTTPNYGWDVPTSTDYVKDGATAIETLGDDVDAFLGTAFNNKLRPGLVLIKSQAITNGVSSVSITSCFNSTFDAYKVVWTGVTTALPAGTALQFGTSNTGYYATKLISGTYSTSGTLTYQSDNNAASVFTELVTSGGAATSGATWEIQNPFGAVTTTFQGHGSDPRTNGLGLRQTSGFHDVATSYTNLTYFVSGTTFTGGRVSVYGYSKD